MKKQFAILLALAAVCGCNLVDDFGSFEDKGTTPDLSLLGVWKSQEPSPTTYEFYISNDDALMVIYSFPDDGEVPELIQPSFPPEGVLVRPIHYEHKSFLLFERPHFLFTNSTIRYILAYTVTPDELTLYAMRDQRIEEGIQSGLFKGTIPERTPYDSSESSVPNPIIAFQQSTIATLTTNVMEYFVDPQNKRYWDNVGVFTKEPKDDSDQ